MNPQEPQSPAGIPPISENPSMNPPVPESPAGIATPQPELSQEQMKANLQGLMTQLQAKKTETDTQMFDTNKSAQEDKSKLFSEVYDFFQKNGVDPTNPEQVKAFLEKLKATQPQVYQQVEQILNEIMSDDSEQPEVAGAPSNNMNIQSNETTPPSI